VALQPEPARDYTLLPTHLDSQFERVDDDGALAATIIKPGRTFIFIFISFVC
jgi:hypothetical protein